MPEDPDREDSVVDLDELTVEQIAIHRVLNKEVNGFTSIEEFAAEFGISESATDANPDSTPNQVD